MSKTPLQVFKEKAQMEHRDGSWRIFSRILYTLAVFLYQGTVFLAQKVLFEQLVICPAYGGSCTIGQIKGSQTIWLVIETATFYLYMFATVIYIAGMALIRTFESSSAVSDARKAVLDFISYAAINLTWFALNFVLCTMPPLCIFVLQRNTGGLTLEGKDGSFLPNMFLIWAIHVLTFLPKMRILKIVPQGADA